MSALSTIQRAVILPAGLFLALLVSQCASLSTLALADSYTDSLQQSYERLGPQGGPGSFNPSPGHDDYNSFQRRQEQFDRAAEAYRQESMRQYQQSIQSHQAAPDKYDGFPYNIITPNGTVTCQSGFAGTSYCR